MYSSHQVTNHSPERLGASPHHASAWSRRLATVLSCSVTRAHVSPMAAPGRRRCAPSSRAYARVQTSLLLILGANHVSFARSKRWYAALVSTVPSRATKARHVWRVFAQGGARFGTLACMCDLWVSASRVLRLYPPSMIDVQSNQTLRSSDDTCSDPYIFNFSDFYGFRPP